MVKKQSNKLSVLMPVYNCERYLDRAIRSILSQTHTDFDFIIVNDGSTDAGLNIIERHMKADSRIRLIDQENRGLIAALNVGIQASNSEYIARMDGDDISHPNRFERQMAFLDNHPHVALLGTGWNYIDEDDRVFNHLRTEQTDRDLKIAIRFYNCFHHPTIIFKRQAVLDIGLYRQEFLHCEDYDLYVRLCNRYEVGNLPDILLDYRIHNAQVCGIGNMEVLTQSFVKAQYVHFKGIESGADHTELMKRDDYRRDYRKELFMRYLWWGALAMQTNGKKNGRIFYKEARKYRDSFADRRRYFTNYCTEMARFSIARKDLVRGIGYAAAIFFLSPPLFLKKFQRLSSRFRRTSL